jgi:hypothetical protein
MEVNGVVPVVLRVDEKRWAPIQKVERHSTTLVWLEVDNGARGDGRKRPRLRELMAKKEEFRQRLDFSARSPSLSDLLH